MIQSIDEVEEERIEKSVLLDLIGFVANQYFESEGKDTIWKIGKFVNQRYNDESE